MPTAMSTNGQHRLAVASYWTRRLLLLLIAGLFPLASNADDAPAPSDEQLEFFETKIRPLLVKHCYECHGEKAKSIKGGLRMDSRSALLEGGESGAAIAPGKPDDSLLIQAVRWDSLEMPPKGKLSDVEIALLTRWVKIGSPWPAERPKPSDAPNEPLDWEQLRSGHWAFRRLSKPRPPSIQDNSWPRGPLDHFILARLETAGLRPAPPADARTLIRRIYFDLIGLPPTAEETAEFVEACREKSDSGQTVDMNGSLPQAAIEKVIDRLLESPHYGERWGRRWLDVARYSDGFGGFLDSAGLPQAWRYRDWVVEALNQDLPFDQFVKLQIAGDLMGPAGSEIATGFFALGPTYRSDGGDPDSVAQAKSETLDDRIDTLSRGFLALTISCARCHDHKFDPVPQLDYYSLAGVFNNTSVFESPLAPPEVVQAYNDRQKEITDLDGKVKQKNKQFKEEKREPTPEEKQQLDAWKAELDQLRKTAPPKYDAAHALRESGDKDMHVAIRGNLRKPGDVAPRRFPRILSGADPPHFKQGSGRLELAEAVASPDNPLTARVFVNRVWRGHFGRALVRSPSNFGSLGERPTHGELLDWLAGEFIDSGWSIKQLHRTIMLSAAFQMSSRFDEKHFSADSDNRLLWRMNPRKLDAESWRDALLAVTGELDRGMGGPPVEQINSRRRTLYFKVSRNGDRFASDIFLRLFDFPLMRSSVAKRPTSIVPQQFLFMMNSPFMIDRAAALASQLESEVSDDKSRIESAYQRLFGRSPTPEEQRAAVEFVSGQTEPTVKLSRWRQYAQVLLSSNEFMFVQ